MSMMSDREKQARALLDEARAIHAEELAHPRVTKLINDLFDLMIGPLGDEGDTVNEKPPQLPAAPTNLPPPPSS